jgi:hypothetical protein
MKSRSFQLLEEDAEEEDDDDDEDDAVGDVASVFVGGVVGCPELGEPAPPLIVGAKDETAAITH